MSIFPLFILGKHTSLSSPTFTPTGNDYPALRLHSRSCWWVSNIGKGFLQAIKYKYHGGKWGLEPCLSTWFLWAGSWHLELFWPSNTSCLLFLLLPAIYRSNHRTASLATRTGGIDNPTPTKGVPEVIIPIPTVTLNIKQYRKLSISALLSLDPKSCHVFVWSLFSQVNSTRLFYKTLFTSNKTQKALNQDKFTTSHTVCAFQS